MEGPIFLDGLQSETGMDLPVGIRMSRDHERREAERSAIL